MERQQRVVIEFWWSVALATLGVVVPGIAALYEFVVKGRKRIGYHVQMDTTATDVAETVEPGALAELRRGGVKLTDPTLVLLRIENNGATHIDTQDYAVPDDDPVGIRVRFPGRRVPGMVVTELSQDYLRPSFSPGNGLASRDDVIELPRVPLNRGSHYKVPAALDQAAGFTHKNGEDFPEPVVSGGIKGGVGGGGIQRTRNRIGTPKRVIALGGVVPVRIGGRPATVADADHGTYPFWETEYGYTYGEPDASSLAASYLRYLTNQVGADIIRSHGDRPCGDLANPQLCHPS